MLQDIPLGHKGHIHKVCGCPQVPYGISVNTHSLWNGQPHGHHQMLAWHDTGLLTLAHAEGCPI